MGSYWKTVVNWCACGAIAALVSFLVATHYKPTPVFYQPTVTINAEGKPLAKNLPLDSLPQRERRQAARQWEELDQKEINDLTALLLTKDKVEVVIYCAEDLLCGDLQLNFDNAFESAHWQTRLEKPFLNTEHVVGISTSSPVLKAAIDAATNGRLNVKIMEMARSPNMPPFEALMIGQKPQK
jgi:hypothetical protein